MKKYILILFLFLVACANTEFSAIRGKSPESVRRIKGEPAAIIHENGYEMWTYRDGECRKMVFFDEDGEAVDWYESGDCVPPQ